MVIEKKQIKLVVDKFGFLGNWDGSSLVDFLLALGSSCGSVYCSCCSFLLACFNCEVLENVVAGILLFVLG